MINSPEDAYRKIAEYDAQKRRVTFQRYSNLCLDYGCCYSNYDEIFGEDAMPDGENGIIEGVVTQGELEKILDICPNEALDFKDAE